MTCYHFSFSVSDSLVYWLCACGWGQLRHAV